MPATVPRLTDPQAHDLLRKPEIQGIAEPVEEHSKGVSCTSDDWLREVKRLALANIFDFHADRRGRP